LKKNGEKIGLLLNVMYETCTNLLVMQSIKFDFYEILFLFIFTAFKLLVSACAFVALWLK
jgi:hypothetical protein